MDQGQVAEEAKVLADNSPADPQTTSQLHSESFPSDSSWQKRLPGRGTPELHQNAACLLLDNQHSGANTLELY